MTGRKILNCGFLFVMNCFFFISCGRNINDSHPSELNALSDEGTFTSHLTPLNQHHFFRFKRSRGLRGEAKMTIREDQLIVQINSSRVPFGAHRHSLYTGSKCPTLADDLNGDQLLDAEEASAVYGKPLVSLDSNINNQAGGSQWYKFANKYGLYHYFKKGSLTRLLTDLRSSSHSEFAKLNLQEGLRLEDRVIVFHGVSKKNYLPKSVKAFFGKSKHATIPIACGVLRRN